MNKAREEKERVKQMTTRGIPKAKQQARPMPTANDPDAPFTQGSANQEII